MNTQLRGSIANPKSVHRFEDEECIDGMARAARAVASFPGNLTIGGLNQKDSRWLVVRISSRDRRLHSCDRVGGEGCWAEIAGLGGISRQAWQAFGD